MAVSFIVGVNRNTWRKPRSWLKSHNVVSSTPHPSGIQTHSVSGIGTDCIGSYRSNYHTIRTTTVPVCIFYCIFKRAFQTIYLNRKGKFLVYQSGKSVVSRHFESTNAIWFDYHYVIEIIVQYATFHYNLPHVWPSDSLCVFLYCLQLVVAMFKLAF